MSDCQHSSIFILFSFSFCFGYSNLAHEVCRAMWFLACGVQVLSLEMVVDGEVKAKEDVLC